MSKRYTKTGEWSVSTDRDPVYFTYPDGRPGVLTLEVADVVDNRTGRVFYGDAFRVAADGRPYKRGKGGSVPFIGETAWMDGARAFDDEVTAMRFAPERSAVFA